MVRMRARKRLSALMSNASSFGFVPFGIRDLARRFSDFARRNTSFSEQASATAVAAAEDHRRGRVLGAPSQAPASDTRSTDASGSQDSVPFASAELASARKATRASIADPAPQQASGRRHVKGAVSQRRSRRDDYDVSSGGDGPAEGGATFGVIPDEDENWQPSAPDVPPGRRPRRRGRSGQAVTWMVPATT